MDAIFRGVKNCFGFTTNAGTTTQNVRHIPHQESTPVILAKQEIERIFLMFEEMRYDEVIELCAEIHSAAIKTSNIADIRPIKDKIFEAGVEIAIDGQYDVALKIWEIVDTPANREMPFTIGTTYHLEANLCISALSCPGNEINFQIFQAGLEAMTRIKEHLKCTPYFLSKVFQNGLFDVERDEEKAQKYLQIATDRGYKPRDLTLFKTQGKHYQLMLQAQQSPASVFYNVPRELINHIAHLRLTAPAPEKKSATKNCF